MIKDYLNENSKIIILDDKDSFNYIADKYIENNSDYDNLNDYNKIKYILNYFKEQTGIYNIDAFYIDNWYKINNKWYYFKSREKYSANEEDDEFELNELLGEYISKYFGLLNAHYEVGQVTDKNKDIIKIGVLSENFYNNRFIYKTLDQYPSLRRCALYSNRLEIFDKIKGLDLDKSTINLEKELKRLFIRDFFVTESDRKIQNLLFYENDKEIRLAPIFDNESSFFKHNDIMHYYSNPLGSIDIMDRNCQTIFNNDTLFQELLYNLMIFNMNNALSLLEEEYGIVIPNDKKDDYIIHTNQIKRLVKENKLIKRL